MADTPISFARGAPALDLIPAAELADCAYAVAQKEGAPRKDEATVRLELNP